MNLPPEKSHPLLSQQPPLKVEVLPCPLFKNFVGGLTPLPVERGRGIHYSPPKIPIGGRGLTAPPKTQPVFVKAKKVNLYDTTVAILSA